MEQVVADLHLHSKYSRAVSKQMEIPSMASWAKLKGIDLLGTGDFTHPLWLRELEAGLEETEEGVYKIKSSKLKVKSQKSENKVGFILTAEISSIYSQGGRLRRIHNLLLAPNFATVRKINQELRNQGANLMADGRPIIGLSSKQLCELAWSVEENCLIISAHAWTPWFSLYGSKSGFDSIEECYGEFAKRIYAIETGLSSDPAMNWRIKELDNRSIISCSDAHSPAKLGREATVFKKVKSPFDSAQGRRQLKVKSSNENFSFKDLAGAIKQDKDCTWEIAYTIEFYPQEGKYHYTGHRNCDIVQAPKETKQKGATCPVCGKPLTVGVMHRVEELAKGSKVELIKKESAFGVQGIYHKQKRCRPPFIMLVPLLEILAESLESTTTSQKVLNEYYKLTEGLGGEFNVLFKAKQQLIASISNPKIAEGVKKVRKGEINIKPGFDGVFGKVSIWNKEEEKKVLAKEQMSLF